jgi:hypothetical protein
LTELNDQISKSNIPDDIKKTEKNNIIEIIKKLKVEFNRKEEVKHKEENVKKLDEKAILLNLKKEDEDESFKNNNDTAISNELSAANISTSTSIALHLGSVDNNQIIGLAPSQDKHSK